MASIVLAVSGALAAAGLLDAPARAENGTLDASTLTAIKQATVFIRVSRGGNQATGSGFVISAKDRRALVATNYHVVALAGNESGKSGAEADWLHSVLAEVILRTDIKVVFDSGTKQERSAKAKVLAADPEADLAILEVSDVDNLPPPISYAQPPPLVETMQVYTFGFPFGSVLADGRNSNPAVTVGKASVSSLLIGSEGELKRVQIDGSINPGNSGGPVVDAHGTLAGIAFATIRNSTGIGLAIPAARLTTMFLGRTGACSLAAARSAEGTWTVKASVILIDPERRIRDVTLVYLPASAVHSRHELPADLTKEAGHRRVSLKLEALAAVGEFSLEGSPESKMLVQIVAQGGSSQSATQPAKTFDIFTRGTSSAPPQVAAKPAPPQTAAKPAPRGRHAKGAPTSPDETAIEGNAFDEVFREAAPAGAVLVGLEASVGKFVSKELISAIRPIFRTPDGTDTPGAEHGKPTDRVVKVVARPGYAVGAVSVRASLFLSGLSVKFMRVDGNHLDPADSYTSEWIGASEGTGSTKSLDSQQRLVVGLIGKEGKKGCTGIGLMLKPANSP